MEEKKPEYKTDRELKALKPRGAWYDAKDLVTRNLIVRVGPEREKADGKKEFRRTFCLVTRFPGSKNPVRHAFGEYGTDLTLEEARALADEWRRLIRQGVDPREAERLRKEEAERRKEEAEKPNKLAFGVVIEAYLKHHVKGQRRAAQVEREIRKELIPIWKDKLVTEITKRDVVELCQTIAWRPALYQAHNVYGHIQTFFNWVIEQARYDLDSSPCDRVSPKRMIGEKKPRQRVLNDDELVAYWRASDRMGYPYGPLMRLLAVTGQRKNEVAEARWREFHPDLVKMLRDRKPDERIDWSKVDKSLKIWTVPPERFKSDATHLVPLTDDALAILETLPHFTGPKTGDHLFSTTSGAKAVNGFSTAKKRLDRFMLVTLKAMARKRGGDPTKAELPKFVIHDVRRTVRTRLSSLRINGDVAEMVIGHGKKGLDRVYNQHEFADEMREALEAWAGRLRSIVSPPPANVVSIEKARA